MPSHLRPISPLRFWIAGVLAVFGLGPECARADRFDDLDRNKDGIWQKDELPAQLWERVKRADADGDGAVTREEDRAFRARARARAVPDSLRVVRDLDYVGAGNQRQTLDLYLPREKSAEPRPLVVFIHGGGWRQGSKEGGLRHLVPILETGRYVGASINYRLSDEAQWPAQIHDCKAAIRWLKSQASTHGYDGERIAVWGTSAGGHLVAMLGATGDVPALEGKLGKKGEHDSKVACVVNYFGPANLLTMEDFPSRIDHSAADSPEGRLIGGALADRKEVARSASPVTHVSEGDAPMLIAHGSKDPLVPHAQSVELAKKLDSVGVPTVFVTLEEAGHGFRSAELDRRVMLFLERELHGGNDEIPDSAIPAGQ